jgi:hypothetical protein
MYTYVSNLINLLLILVLLLISVSCTTIQKKNDIEDQIEGSKKPYAPSRNHIPRS